MANKPKQSDETVILNDTLEEVAVGATADGTIITALMSKISELEAKVATASIVQQTREAIQAAERPKPVIHVPPTNAQCRKGQFQLPSGNSITNS